jgi:hypothetical protein
VTDPPCTEFSFVLPRGYRDEHGDWHRDGVMRLATARDELTPLCDPRVQANDAYLNVLLLARVITKLGRLPIVSPGIVECLFASDLAFLQDLYRRVNQEVWTEGDVACPECGHRFAVDRAGDALGEAG